MRFLLFDAGFSLLHNAIKGPKPVAPLQLLLSGTLDSVRFRVEQVCARLALGALRPFPLPLLSHGSYTAVPTARPQDHQERYVEKILELCCFLVGDEKFDELSQTFKDIKEIEEIRCAGFPSFLCFSRLPHVVS